GLSMGPRDDGAAAQQAYVALSRAVVGKPAGATQRQSIFSRARAMNLPPVQRGARRRPPPRPTLRPAADPALSHQSMIAGISGIRGRFFTRPSRTTVGIAVSS